MGRLFLGELIGVVASVECDEWGKEETQE